jgi:radical SAM superfamily enzyme YgiQ (UPF0313 family)
MSEAYRFLMIYPQFEPSYWGMQYALPIIRRKSLMPPLGLITIAAMVPATSEVRLVDLNTRPLRDDDIQWAEVVLFSAMLVQKDTLLLAAARCRQAGKMVVFGGPYPTACPDECRPYCDVLVLNEGEVTWPLFLRDLESGQVQPVYSSSEKPDITQSPVPRFDLLNVNDYVSMPIQFSRGCPYNCEFCDITVLFGRRPRTKTPAQLLRELDELHETGYRGQVFIVDDNFIANKAKVMELLPELLQWNHQHGYPFAYGTEATVNLGDDPTLLQRMVEAGFIFVFLGIETPSLESLRETGKYQNLTGSLLNRVLKVQQAGLLVYGGFIVGFDHDSPDIFDRQIEFITAAAIANAMVGPLMALPGTLLFDRMKREDRLLNSSEYGNWYESGHTNIVTVMDHRQLLDGLRRIVKFIYEPSHYFDRALRSFQLLPRHRSYRGRWSRFRRFANHYRQSPTSDSEVEKPSLRATLAFFIELYRGLPRDFRKPLVRFLREVIRTCPEHLPQSLPFLCMGYHNFRFTAECVLPKIDAARTRLGLSGELVLRSPDIGARHHLAVGRSQKSSNEGRSA